MRLPGASLVRAMVATFFALVAFVCATGQARAEPVRILIAVGHRFGLEGERPLHHADRDASRVRDIFTSLGGVRPENALLLAEPTPAALLAAFDRAQAIARAHRPEEVTFLFYFSGHGDREKLHLGPTPMPMSELSARVSQVPAALRIVALDACRTDTTRVKGVTVEEPFAITLTAPAAMGLVWLHASADGEAAQESDELGGAIFTHYWLSGLSGAADADGDSRVTLSESYSFAYSQTLYRSSRSSGVVQRPSAVFDVREAAPVVLTQTWHDTTALRFPQSADAHYLVYALGSRSVMAEVWGVPDRSAMLAVPAGRYVIQRRLLGAGSALDVTIARGEQRDLHAADFREIAAEPIARKGEEDVVVPDERDTQRRHEAGLSYGPLISGVADFGQRLALTYGYRGHRWALTFGVEGGIASQKTVAEDVRLQWLGTAARIEWRIPIGRPTLRFGAGPEGQLIGQQLTRRDASRVALAGYPTVQSYSAFAGGGGALVAIRVPLAGDTWWFDGAARGALLASRLGDAVGAIWVAGLDAAVGVAF